MLLGKVEWAPGEGEVCLLGVLASWGCGQREEFPDGLSIAFVKYKVP